MRLNRWLLGLIIFLMGGGSAEAFYSEIYEQRETDLYEQAPKIENIIQRDKHRGLDLTGAVLSEEAKEYIFWCPETNYDQEALENLSYFETPNNEQEKRGDLTIVDYLTSQDVTIKKCLDIQKDLYKRQIQLKHFGNRTAEKLNEGLGDYSFLPQGADVEAIAQGLGGDHDFFAALRQNIMALHGPDEAAKITDFTYFDAATPDQSPQPPQNLYGEGRPLKPNAQPQKNVALQPPGANKGNGGVMATLEQMI